MYLIILEIRISFLKNLITILMLFIQARTLMKKTNKKGNEEEEEEEEWQEEQQEGIWYVKLLEPCARVIATSQAPSIFLTM